MIINMQQQTKHAILLTINAPKYNNSVNQLNDDLPEPLFTLATCAAVDTAFTFKYETERI